MHKQTRIFKKRLKRRRKVAGKKRFSLDRKRAVIKVIKNYRDGRFNKKNVRS